MKITLNKLINIRNDLSKLVGAGSSTRSGYDGYYTIIFSATPEINQKKLAEQRLNTINKLEDVHLMIESLAVIKNLISDENEKNGVNRVLGEISKIDQLLSAVYNVFTADMDGCFDYEDFDELMDKTIGDVYRNQMVNVLTKEERDQRKQAKRQLVKKKRDMVETRNGLNHKSLIELPNDLVATLKKFDLV